MTRLQGLAAWGPLPPVAQQLIAEKHPKLRASLLRNPNLDVGVARWLFARRPAQAETVRMVKDGNDPALIDALVESGETRPKVVEALVRHWRLDARHQQILAGGDIDDANASLMLRADWLSGETAGEIVYKAGTERALDWVCANHDRFDERGLYNCVARIADGADLAGHEGLAALMYDRPALRHAAAISGLWLLAGSAVSCELTAEEQHAVVDTYLAAGGTGRRGWGLVPAGLLDRTGTTAEVREQVASILDAAGKADELCVAGIPRAQSIYPVGVGLADIDDRAVLEMLCLRAAEAPHVWRRAQWLELAGNAHLDETLALHLAGRLKATYASGVVALAERFAGNVTLAALGERCGTRGAAVRRMQASSGVPACTVRADYAGRRYPRRGGHDVDPQVQGSSYHREDFEGRPDLGGKVLAEAIGAHRDAWEVCFSLLDTFEGPSSRLGEISAASVR